MGIESELSSILVSLVSIVDQAYKYLISAFWYISVQYGLKPGYAFIQTEFGNAGFTSLFSAFTGLYAQVIAIGLLVSALFFLFENSFMRAVASRDYLVRIAVSVALVVFSFDIMRAVLYVGYKLYEIPWNDAGINWYSLSSVVNTNYAFLNTLNYTATENELVEFFLLSSLFVSVGTLFGVLMIREAILLVLMVALPFISVLTLISKFDSYTTRFWSLFFQLSVLPFFVIIPLYLASLFPANFPLQLSLVTGAALMPVLFVSATRIFSLGSLYSLLDSMSFQRSMERLPLPALQDIVQPGNPGSRQSGNAGFEMNAGGTVDWSKVYSRDFNYSRFGER